MAFLPAFENWALAEAPNTSGKSTPDWLGYLALAEDPNTSGKSLAEACLDLPHRHGLLSLGPHLFLLFPLLCPLLHLCLLLCNLGLHLPLFLRQFSCLHEELRVQDQRLRAPYSPCEAHSMWGQHEAHSIVLCSLLALKKTYFPPLNGRLVNTVRACQLCGTHPLLGFFREYPVRVPLDVLVNFSRVFVKVNRLASVDVVCSLHPSPQHRFSLALGLECLCTATREKNKETDDTSGSLSHESACHTPRPLSTRHSRE